jgi:hypothetical protein
MTCQSYSAVLLATLCVWHRVAVLRLTAVQTYCNTPPTKLPIHCSWDRWSAVIWDQCISKMLWSCIRWDMTSLRPATVGEGTILKILAGGNHFHPNMWWESQMNQISPCWTYKAFSCMHNRIIKINHVYCTNRSMHQDSYIHHWEPSFTKGTLIFHIIVCYRNYIRSTSFYI